MIATNNIAKAQTTINATSDKVWNALIDPEIIKKYMFGTTVISDWKEGSKIVWKGEWEGRSYEDKGKILRLEPNKELQYSHFSPLSGLDDKPENYHIVTIGLAENDKQTIITLAQDNNADEKTKDHSEKNWEMMLASLKKLLEETN
ncbi:MAG TPA: SRPBCC domain-containing protein [Chitinophagaceae bacterium]|nr:SRPBCC domain-containing protein [Chitinophagaceae bacterium]